MGAIKNAVYKVDNGTDFDEIHFKTKASQVICDNGKTAEAQLAEMMNEGLINSSGWFKDKKTGLIIQWGTTSIALTSSRGGVDITFPIAFPIECMHISGSCYGINNQASNDIDSVIFSARPSSLARANLRARHITSGLTYTVNLMWIALGK